MKSKSEGQHFCLIFRSLETGGIQTLMARMADWLTRKGSRVTILAEIGGTMVEKFPEGVRVIISTQWYMALRTKGIKSATRFLSTVLEGDEVDVFYCFSDEAVWIAIGLINAQTHPARCLAGVYGPRDYGIGAIAQKLPILAPLLYPESCLYMGKLPPSCRLFMNEQIRKQVEELSLSPVAGEIWPIPVDGTRFEKVIRSPARGLIVSVGRLNPMKEYNLWMIDVVEELLSDGLDVRWEVYGDGPFRNEMIRKVSEKKLEGSIFIKGEISYERFTEVLEKAYVFVGMGTALIEAGYAGVPGIAATVSDTEGLTHGFLHELPGFSCGEPLQHPTRRVADLLRQVFRLDSEGYIKLADAQRQHAVRFDADSLMEGFLRLVAKAPLLTYLSRPGWQMSIALKYRKVRNIIRQLGRRSQLSGPQ